MVEALKKHNKIDRKGPVVLIIMDGVGFGQYDDGDAVKAAMTKNLDGFLQDHPWTKLKAHGTAVGLPTDDDMGNSEVGHNAIGSGRVFAQGAALVSNAIDSGSMYTSDTWKKLTSNVVKNDSTLHFLGLLSDGNVHAHIKHVKAMVAQAKKDGVKKVRLHSLLDGRDVGALSALEYFDPFVEYLNELNDENFDARIASGGGRQNITMDRYNANWSMVERGWHTHVLGEGRQFASAREAILTLREETGAIDQDLPPFVIAENGKPVGTVEDGDSFILYNFRGDRALEITKAFEAEDLKEFDRVRFPKVEYAGILQYDGDLKIPAQYLVSPPSIDRTMAEYLCASGVRQYSISETQKYGHITYFFNGNKSGMIDSKLEKYVEVLSDLVPFEERPWMKCADIADKVIEAVESGEWDFIKLNFPNGDMVGHTGVFQAVTCSMEAMDLQLGRLWKAIKKAGGVMVVTADHGNADDMYEHDKKGNIKLDDNGIPKNKTCHSLNPVPCIVVDSDYKGEYSTEFNTGLGITSLAATCMNLLGYEPPADYDKSVINVL